jgi:Leucine-rich repeat (LRR) protein
MMVGHRNLFSLPRVDIFVLEVHGFFSSFMVLRSFCIFIFPKFSVLTTCQTITELSLLDLGLVSLPSYFVYLKNLRKLVLDQNKLTCFPVLGLLGPSFSYLSVKHNVISQVDPSLQFLGGLEKLYLDNNQ